MISIWRHLVLVWSPFSLELLHSLKNWENVRLGSFTHPSSPYTNFLVHFRDSCWRFFIMHTFMLYIYILYIKHTYIYILYILCIYYILYIHKKNNFNVCDRCEHQKSHIFFHTDIFRNCITSSVYVWVKDTCWKFSIYTNLQWRNC